MGYQTFIDRCVAKARAFTFRPYVSQLEISHLRIKVHIDDVIGDLWYGGHRYRHIIWPQIEFDWMIRNTREDDIIYDIGAHQAVWAILFGLLAPKGHVVAIETSPFNTAVGRRNIAANGLANITLENLCAGEGPGMVQVSDDAGGVASLAVHNPSRLLMLEQTSLDDYAERTGLWPTLIKIDVEGFERECLRGMQKALARKPKLMLELTSFKFPDRVAYVRECLSLVDRSAYANFAIQHEVGGDMVYLGAAGEPDWDRLSRSDNPHLYFW